MPCLSFNSLLVINMNNWPDLMELQDSRLDDKLHAVDVKSNGLKYFYMF